MSIAPSDSLDLYPRPTGLRMSYEAFLKLGDEYRHAEWVNGEVVMMASVVPEHERVRLWLLRLMSDFLEGAGIGECLGEPVQVKLGADLPGRQPDLFVILREHAHRVTDQNVEGPPDFIIEIISRGTRRVDRIDKFQEYERGGVPEYWIIDPARKLAEFYRLTNGRYAEHEPDAEGIYRSSAVAGFWIKPAWLWQRPLPATADALREMKVI